MGTLPPAMGSVQCPLGKQTTQIENRSVQQQEEGWVQFCSGRFYSRTPSWGRRQEPACGQLDRWEVLREGPSDSGRLRSPYVQSKMCQTAMRCRQVRRCKLRNKVREGWMWNSGRQPPLGGGGLGRTLGESAWLQSEASESGSVVSDSVRPRDSPGQTTGVGSRSLLQGVFPTQGSNPGLLHCGRTLYQLSRTGSRAAKVTSDSPRSCFLTARAPWCVYLGTLQLLHVYYFDSTQYFIKK